LKLVLEYRNNKIGEETEFKTFFIYTIHPKLGSWGWVHWSKLDPTVRVKKLTLGSHENIRVYEVELDIKTGCFLKVYSKKGKSSNLVHRTELFYIDQKGKLHPVRYTIEKDRKGKPRYHYVGSCGMGWLPVYSLTGSKGHSE